MKPSEKWEWELSLIMGTGWEMGMKKKSWEMGMNGNQSTLRAHLQSSRHVGCDCTLSPPVESCVRVSRGVTCV